MNPRIVTVTVSDTRTRENDEAEKIFADALHGFAHVRHALVPDDAEGVRSLIRDVIAAQTAEVMVLSGGTGIAPRDQTFEAVESLFDKRIDGFGEAFRRLSWDQVGPRAMLSRATAGVIARCLLFSLPGSPRGLRLGLEALIVPVLHHAVDLVHGRTHHHEGVP